MEIDVVTVARDVCALLGLAEPHIEHVEDRHYNDQRYRIDSSKLEQLGWHQQVAWRDGLARTVQARACVPRPASRHQWYRDNMDFWPDIALALAPHPIPIPLV